MDTITEIINDILNRRPVSLNRAHDAILELAKVRADIRRLVDLGLKLSADNSKTNDALDETRRSLKMERRRAATYGKRIDLYAAALLARGITELTCPTCKGEKIVQVEVLNQPNPYETQDARCPDCEGEGVLIIGS